MKVLFMGTPDFASESLQALLEHDFDVVGVFTQPDKPVGRKHVLTKPPVKQLAEKMGIPVFQPLKLRDGIALDTVRQLSPDVIVVVAYGRILPMEIIEYPRYGSVNIHASVLPKYRGAAPIQWAVLNGERETGVTAMHMAEELDAGDIIDIRKTDILEGETAGELRLRLASIGAELLCDTLLSLENGTAHRTPQDPSQATLAPPLRREDALLDWNLSGRKLVCLVNGLNPWPVALGNINGTEFKIFKAECAKRQTALPGTVLSAGKSGIEVACADGALLITELQAPGGKRMGAGEYLRGHPICQ